MITYRPFSSLTKEEIAFVVNDIFHPADIPEISFDNNNNTFDVRITTKYTNSNSKISKETVELRLNQDNIYPIFSTTPAQKHKWKQFLYAKGCDERLRNNPYLESETNKNDFRRIDFETGECDSNGNHVLKTGEFSVLFNRNVISEDEVEELICSGATNTTTVLSLQHKLLPMHSKGRLLNNQKRWLKEMNNISNISNTIKKC